ncbi:MAG: PAS domain S-box protein [Calditrichaeota bacterium]|nr:PAS domain S-box protein [Calditrichota bacterium]
MQITAQSFKDHFWKYTNDLFALLDEGGSFVKVNNAWKKQLGFSETELLETRFSDVFVDVDQHIIYNSLEDLRHKRKTETTILGSIKNSEKPFLFMWTICYDSDIQKFDVVGVRIEPQNIKDQKDNLSPANIFIFNLPNHKYEYISREMVSFTGYALRELYAMGDKLLETLVHPDDLEKVLMHMDILANGEKGKIVEFENRMLRIDGKMIWVSNRISGFRYDKKDKPIEIIGSIEDITKHKVEIQKIQEQKEFLRSIFTGIEMALFVVDVAVDGEFYYRELNPVYERLTGLTTEWIKGRKPDELHPRFSYEIIDLIKSRYANCVDSGENIQYEEQRNFDGQESWWLTTLTPLKEVDGRIFRIVGSSALITKQKQLENDLKASNKELAEFGQSISHDLQAPLRRIASFAQLLEMDYKDKLDDEAKDFIQKIYTGAKQMQTMIQELLKYSRISHRELNMREIDMNWLIKDAILVLDKQIELVGGKIKTQNLPTVHGNKQMLSLLFQNLISNAIKYNERLPEIEIGVYQDENSYVFWVKDNGIGIEKEYFGDIFKTFRRLHPSNKYSGTGIGLSNCKKIVERHGGEIWLESTVTEGSTFFVRLPHLTNANS